MNAFSLSRTLLLLSVLLLLPGTGFAASSYRLLEAELPGPELEVEQPWRPPGLLRVGTELAVGTVGAVGLGFAGLYGGARVCSIQGNVERGCLVEVLSGLWTGSSLGFALGVWGGGSLMGGRGHILPVLGGLAAGWLLGAGSFYLTRGLITPAVGAALMTPYIFSLVAYELSSAAAWKKSPPRAAGARVQPVLSFSSQGALLGLAGSF